MSLPAKLHALKREAHRRVTALPSPYPAFNLYLSISDGSERAQIVHGSGTSFDVAWTKMIVAAGSMIEPGRSSKPWLRLDWPERAEMLEWSDFLNRLHRTKRNYFRQGISFDADLRLTFLEQELNGNAMLYGGNQTSHAVWNARNAKIYAATRHGVSLPAEPSADMLIHLLATTGLFCDGDGTVMQLAPAGLDGGRRVVTMLDEDTIVGLVAAGSDYLARQVQPDGRFVYGYHPCFNRRISAYNTLRHASTTYAMIEAWEVTGDPGLRSAIERSVQHLTRDLIRKVDPPGAAAMAFLIDEEGEIKLGGNGVALLALTRHAVAFGSREHSALMERLALGIGYMQDADGSFRHVLRSSDLAVKQAFRTIYYEGEAAFGLMRLYSLTQDPRWIGMVEAAFAHFIREDHWRHHDHWLSYCVNELTRYRPEGRYFQFGLRNVSGYLDFVTSRITTFPTLLELMMAAREMLSRIDADPVHRPMLEQIDLPAFLDALERRASYLMNGHFWPELAMYFAKPERIVGSFFIRHHAFRVRIDDVEHYLSGLIAYGRYLPERAAFVGLAARRGGGLPTDKGFGWSAGEVASATGGSWVSAPGPGWSATGLCTYEPAYRPGDLVVVRTSGTRGVRPEALAQLTPAPSGLITDRPGAPADGGPPTLNVANVEQAVMGLGRHARSRLEGRVIGVTGSAGKTTTTAMMAHALGFYGSVAQTREGANLPVGLAWNLASVPRDTAYVVLEVAIGSMRRSARLAQPHVVLFTNILPSHLIHHGDTATIARKKSAIFLGMEPGGIAVLNHDMQRFAIVREAARARGARVLTYGRTEDAELRLLCHDEGTGRVVARLRGREAEWTIGAGGAHMALNSLAVAGGIIALDLPLEPMMLAMDSFAALPGRGQVLDVEFDGRRITVIDDAYNANPGSMAAALTRLSGVAKGRRTVAVLGQMAELGPGEEGYHADLAGLVSQLAISEVHVMGPLYARFWSTIPPQARGSHVASLDDLQRTLREGLRDGDVVLIKGSNSTSMQKVVSWIRHTA